MLFPERVELEQDPNVQQAEEGDTDTASNGGLKRQQPDLNRTGSRSTYFDGPDGPEWMSQLSAREGDGTCLYSFATQMITSTAQLRWRTQKYSAL